MRTSTLTRVAALATGRRSIYDGRTQDSQSTLYSLEGLRRDNDGSLVHWMHDGEIYTLRHDGTGWAITAPTLPHGHTYRLAVDDHGAIGSNFAKAVPSEDGSWIDLDPMRMYALALEDGWGTVPGLSEPNRYATRLVALFELS